MDYTLNLKCITFAIFLQMYSLPSTRIFPASCTLAFTSKRNEIHYRHNLCSNKPFFQNRYEKRSGLGAVSTHWNGPRATSFHSCRKISLQFPIIYNSPNYLQNRAWLTPKSSKTFVLLINSF